jgi:LysM repeat protein
MIRAFAITVLAFAALVSLPLSAEIATADNTYTVQDGDTLIAVATKFNVPSNQLLDWVASTVTLNGLAGADDLKIGQVLKLPSSTSVSAPTSQAAQSTDPSAKTTSSGSYTVVDGDTLLGIAAKNGIPADQQLAWVTKVLALNGLSSADQLAIGQPLRLPGEATAPVRVDAASATSTASASTSGGSSTAPGAASSSSGVLKGYASSYADSFANKPMGCTGAGPYKPTDTTIVAVGPAMYDQFPCGTSIEVCGPKGCLTGVRKDACPGCQSYHVDLSRAGLTAVCGPNACEVRLRRLP